MVSINSLWKLPAYFWPAGTTGAGQRQSIHTCIILTDSSPYKMPLGNLLYRRIYQLASEKLHSHLNPALIYISKLTDLKPTDLLIQQAYRGKIFCCTKLQTETSGSLWYYTMCSISRMCVFLVKDVQVLTNRYNEYWNLCFCSVSVCLFLSNWK